ncbi:MAG: hypothetical protein Q9195_005659 [Heterodermia aff. obscurata]
MQSPNPHSTGPSTPVSSFSSAYHSDTAAARHAQARALNPNVDRKPAKRHAQARALNPNVDRQPAKVDHVDLTKLTIFVQHPPPMFPTRLYYPCQVDWSDQKSISSLNLWRGRNLRYWYGKISEDSGMPTRIYCNEETVYLLREAKAGGFTWSQLTKRFNEEFQGKLLKDCHVRRPLRTKDQLMKLYRRELRRETKTLATEVEKNSDDDGIAASGSESELEEGEIREYTSRSIRPWEL